MRLLNWMTTSRMPPKCFISHKFHDGDGLKHLLANLPAHVEPYIFKEITVTPDRRVSDDLVAAIKGCAGVIYLNTKTSLQSPWVSFERDYALRSGIPVYSYNPDTSRFRKDTSPPLPLNVYPMFVRKDRATVGRILDFLARRSFDVFDTQNEDADLRRLETYDQMVERHVTARLKAGGYVVAFVSDAYKEKELLWGQLLWVREKWPDRMLIALIPDRDNGTLPDASEFPTAVTIDVQDSGNMDWRRVDDLIVRIFYLAFQSAIAKAAPR